MKLYDFYKCQLCGSKEHVSICKNTFFVLAYCSKHTRDEVNKYIDDQYEEWQERKLELNDLRRI